MAVVCAVVYQYHIGKGTGNGRAVEVIGISDLCRRHLALSTVGNAYCAVAHKYGAKVESLSDEPRVCGANVVLINSVVLAYGEHVLSGNRIIIVDENALGYGVAHKFDYLSVILGESAAFVCLISQEGDLSLKRSKPTAVCLGAALIDYFADMVSVVLCAYSEVIIDGGFDSRAVVYLYPEVEVG